jgi:hypothetical protein
MALSDEKASELRQPEHMWGYEGQTSLVMASSVREWGPNAKDCRGCFHVLAVGYRVEEACQF